MLKVESTRKITVLQSFLLPEWSEEAWRKGDLTTNSLLPGQGSSLSCVSAVFEGVEMASLELKACAVRKCCTIALSVIDWKLDTVGALISQN